MDKINSFKFIKIKNFLKIPFLPEVIWKHLIKILNISSKGFYLKKTLIS